MATTTKITIKSTYELNIAIPSLVLNFLCINLTKGFNIYAIIKP